MIEALRDRLTPARRFLVQQKSSVGRPSIRHRESTQSRWNGVDVVFRLDWSSKRLDSYSRELLDVASEELERYQKAYPETKLYYHCEVQVTVKFPGQKPDVFSVEDVRQRNWSTKKTSNPDMTIYGDEDIPEEDWFNSNNPEFWLAKVFADLFELKRRYESISELEYPFTLDKLTLCVREHTSEKYNR